MLPSSKCAQCLPTSHATHVSNDELLFPVPSQSARRKSVATVLCDAAVQRDEFCARKIGHIGIGSGVEHEASRPSLIPVSTQNTDGPTIELHTSNHWPLCRDDHAPWLFVEGHPPPFERSDHAFAYTILSADEQRGDDKIEGSVAASEHFRPL